jgi:PAS domain S-box-containing protein
MEGENIMKILYVEDNPRDAELLKRALNEQDPKMQVDIAVTLKQAEAKLQEAYNYDLALVDLQLPDGSGFDLLKEIRKQELPLAVIILTGHGDEEAAVAALKAGADDYLVKGKDYLERLPLTLEAALKAFKAEAARKKQPFNLLYIEHNSSDLDLTRRHLARYAPHIYLHDARTAVEALPLLSEDAGRYDVLMLDYRLPGLNALELLKELKQVLKVELPVVLVTGQGDEEIAVQALRLGAADYLTKHPGYLYQLPAVLENAYHLCRLAGEQFLLRESEERYRRLAENAQDIIYRISMNPERHFEYVSPAATTITGYTPEEHYANPDLSYSLVHPEDRHLLTKAAEGKLPPDQPLTLRWVRKDGGVIWTEQRNVPLYDNKGTLIALEGIARDITGRKEAEEKLKSNYALLNLAGKTAKFGGWSVSLSDNRVIWSDEVAAIHDRPAGYSPPVDEGINYYAPRWRETIIEMFTACVDQGVPYDEKMEIITAKGARKWVRTTGEAVRDGNGKISKVQGSFQDITEQYMAEEALRSRLNELEVLYTTSSSLRTASALDELLTLLLDETLHAFGAEAGAICLYHQTNEHLRFTVTRDWFKNLDDALLKPGEGIGGQVYSTGKAFISEELANEPSLKYTNLVPAGWSGACIPIHLENKIIGALYIATPLPHQFSEEEIQLLVSLTEMAGTAIHRICLFEELQHSNLELKQAYDATIESLARSLELRDYETEGHCRRVVETTLMIASRMGIPDEQLIHLQRGSLLHDIGKMGISDAIILKPGPLTDEEWTMMRLHPQYAYDLLKPVTYLEPALEIPYCHHEKWDGTGYPRGLIGEEIPLPARIFAVVDVYDALTSDRPYRKAWSREKALSLIREESGKHFDPQVVAVFLQEID